MKKLILTNSYWFLFLTLLTGQEITLKHAIPIGDRTSDSLVLVDFNKQLSGDIWKIKWDFQTPLDEWYGILLNERGRVFCIDLDGDSNCTAERFGGNHLHGFLPNLQLPFLEHLFLSSNKIQGNIPDFSGSPYLQTLQLSGNKFEGRIPEFYFLEHLSKLDLEYNKLSGPIPIFESLTNLEAIYLGHNKLSGAMPDFFYNEKLKQIFINDNNLNKSLANLDHLTNLEQLILSNNHLRGAIDYFEKNKQLKLLNLSNNNLSGCIALNRYQHIAKLDYSKNRLTRCADLQVYVPNAFSPNDDGINDLFEIGFSKTDNPPKRILLNIWTENKILVYSSTDYKNDWNGVSLENGQILREGTYMYELKIDNADSRSGWLYLRR